MKKAIIALALFSLLLSACAAPADKAEEASGGVAVTDAFGTVAYVRADSRVVCCYASFAQCWQLSGGTLAGATLDAVEERGLELPPEAGIVGTVKSIDLERLASLEPDYVILSADLSAHMELKPILEQMGIPCGYFRVDSFKDYKAMMAQFCAVNGGDELYEKHVSEVEAGIEAVLDRTEGKQGGSYLLLRAYSTGMRVKGADILAGQILEAIGMENVADAYPSALEELSMEQIILADPDYIFVVTMGDEAGAGAYLRDYVESDPAWGGLRAVRAGNYHVLPQDLFHHKPNERWDESYEYLAKIIYPELFG